MDKPREITMRHRLRYILCFLVGFTAGTVVTTHYVHQQVKTIIVPEPKASGAVMLLGCPPTSSAIIEWHRVCKARTRTSQVHP